MSTGREGCGQCHTQLRVLRPQPRVLLQRRSQVAGQAIRAAAQAKDNPADLINVALEELVRARLELPTYGTLDDLAARIRTPRSIPRCSRVSPPG